MDSVKKDLSDSKMDKSSIQVLVGESVATEKKSSASAMEPVPPPPPLPSFLLQPLKTNRPSRLPLMSTNQNISLILNIISTEKTPYDPIAELKKTMK